ncbi:NHLP leader peptide family RiPP precursor [Chryseobacterium nepalense]|jgi:hypothetical protein|uniref:NHLP leader peptide family RiPP n=1 Tax=Chryseobacterium nepalense TaxID=1854498 RepID=A0ABY4K4K2_9FLAO|nr:NHLP leader peptide family RiPP precursor [Chryseobacterium nepalense]MEC5171711.1 hypothetical protein [Chryseobacterium nepalense]UPQ75679.1 NHLP leader peptide family RiPP precursor [Chryseobacterium nepalense]
MEFTQEQKFYAQIVQKAWESAEFKNDLMANPIEAIEKLTGQKLNLPEGKTLVVRDQSDESVVYVNIPAAPKNSEDLELTEAELEAVSGGGTIVTTISTPTIVPTIIVLTVVPSPTFPTKDIQL